MFIVDLTLSDLLLELESETLAIQCSFVVRTCIHFLSLFVNQLSVLYSISPNISFHVHMYELLSFFKDFLYSMRLADTCT